MENREEPGKTELESFSDARGIISARGTGEGLVLRIDSRESNQAILMALQEFVSARRSFINGNEVMLEWIGAKPGGSLVSEVSEYLKNKFEIEVKSSSVKTKKRETEIVNVPEERTMSLFDGIEVLGDKKTTAPEPGDNSKKWEAVPMWDDPDARIMYKTLRSGQKVETDHSLILIGDVNFGAEIVSGGDVVVLGTVRGIVHAGAYDESGGGRFIFSLDLRPTQLRIGSVISRGAEKGSKSAEIAWVDGANIVVEEYQAKNVINRSRIS